MNKIEGSYSFSSGTDDTDQVQGCNAQCRESDSLDIEPQVLPLKSVANQKRSREQEDLLAGVNNKVQRIEPTVVQPHVHDLPVVELCKLGMILSEMSIFEALPAYSEEVASRLCSIVGSPSEQDRWEATHTVFQIIMRRGRLVALLESQSLVDSIRCALGFEQSTERIGELLHSLVRLIKDSSDSLDVVNQIGDDGIHVVAKAMLIGFNHEASNNVVIGGEDTVFQGLDLLMEVFNRIVCEEEALQVRWILASLDTLLAYVTHVSHWPRTVLLLTKILRLLHESEPSHQLIIARIIPAIVHGTSHGLERSAGQSRLTSDLEMTAAKEVASLLFPLAWQEILCSNFLPSLFPYLNRNNPKTCAAASCVLGRLFDSIDTSNMCRLLQLEPGLIHAAIELLTEINPGASQLQVSSLERGWLWEARMSIISGIHSISLKAFQSYQIEESHSREMLKMFVDAKLVESISTLFLELNEPIGLGGRCLLVLINQCLDILNGLWQLQVPSARQRGIDADVGAALRKIARKILAQRENLLSALVRCSQLPHFPHSHDIANRAISLQSTYFPGGG